MYRSLQTDILTAEDDPCNETSEVCTRGKLKGCFRGDYDQWHSCGSTCCSITSKIQTSIKGSYGVLNSWKSLEVCPAIFQTWKKSGKMLKSLEFFFFFSNLQQELYKWFFFSFWSNLIQSSPYVFTASWKIFVPAFFKVCINHLFDNLESGKRNHCFGKKVSKKSWILDPKICTNPVYSKDGEQLVLLVIG